VVGCNIPVFVDIENPSISFGQCFDLIKIGMHARMYIVSIQQLMKSYKGGKLLLHNGHIV
jgi:hypothetical protein